MRASISAFNVRLHLWRLAGRSSRDSGRKGIKARRAGNSAREQAEAAKENVGVEYANTVCKQRESSFSAE